MTHSITSNDRSFGCPSFALMLFHNVFCSLISQQYLAAKVIGYLFVIISSNAFQGAWRGTHCAEGHGGVMPILVGWKYKKSKSQSLQVLGYIWWRVQRGMEGHSKWIIIGKVELWGIFWGVLPILAEWKSQNFKCPSFWVLVYFWLPLANTFQVGDNRQSWTLRHILGFFYLFWLHESLRTSNVILQVLGDYWLPLATRLVVIAEVEVSD